MLPLPMQGPCPLEDGVLKHLGSAEIEPPVFIIPGVLPRGLSILGADPKVGKTNYAIAFSLAVAAGPEAAHSLPVWMRKATHGRVLYMHAEGSAGDMKHIALHGLGHMPGVDTPIEIIDDPWAMPLDGEMDAGKVPAGTKKLLEFLNWYQPTLTVIDPFKDFHSLPEEDAISMIGMLKPVRQWHYENDRACLLVHHLRKKGTEAPRFGQKAQPPSYEMLRGSSAIFGKVDGLMVVNYHPDGMSHWMAAWFKRAPSWTRVLRPGFYRKDLNYEGFEVLTNLDSKVLNAVKQLPPSLEALRVKVELAAKDLDDTLMRLLRNGYIRKVKENGVVTARPAR